MSDVIVHRRVMRYVSRLSSHDVARLRTALSRLAKDPTAYPGVIAMAGEWAGYFRIRVGDLRVIFWYDKQDDIVYVDHVGPRGDIYKQ